MGSWIPVGLDFSPSSTGVCSGTGTRLAYRCVSWSPSPDGVKKSWRERRAAALRVVEQVDVLCGAGLELGKYPFVAIEDFAKGFGSSSHIEIAESRGFLLQAFIDRGWAFVLVAPSRVKGFVKAKDKQQVQEWVEAYITECGCPEIRGFNARQYGDVCDAFVLWRIADLLLNDQSQLPSGWLTGESSVYLDRNGYLEPMVEDGVQ